MRAAAYSDEVLKQSKNSELIELDDGRAVVVRVSEHKPSVLRPISEVSDDIRRELATELAFSAVQTRSEQALSDLRSGMTLESIAQRDKTQILKAEAVRRSGSDLPASLVNQAFAQSRPGPDKR